MEIGSYILVEGSVDLACIFPIPGLRTASVEGESGPQMCEFTPRLHYFVSALLLFAAPLSGWAQNSKDLDKELSFGVKMAQRGLWSEALFRFHQVSEDRPGDARVLNNLAVAYEAVGQYEQALEIYQQALAADPANRELKQNYSRFLEFYQAFKGPREEAQAEPLMDLPSEPPPVSSGR